MEAKKKKRMKETFVFLLFVLPAVIFVLFSTDVPFFMNGYYAMFDWNGISSDKTFVGLGNFIEIFTNSRNLFWKGLKFTLKFTVFYVIIVNILSLSVALALSKENKKSSVGRAFYYIPYIISLTTLSLIWKFIFGPGFEALYNLTGCEFFSWSWVGTPKLVFYVIVIMAVWQNVGFYMVNYIAGIIAVPKELLEAARIDGATTFQVFKNITMPLIMPSVSICILTSLTYAFKMFDIIMVFTKGGPANSTITVAYDIYREAFTKHNYGMATAKSLIFVVFVLMITVVQLKVTKTREVES